MSQLEIRSACNCLAAAQRYSVSEVTSVVAIWTAGSEAPPLAIAIILVASEAARFEAPSLPVAVIAVAAGSKPGAAATIATAP